MMLAIATTGHWWQFLLVAAVLIGTTLEDFSKMRKGGRFTGYGGRLGSSWRVLYAWSAVRLLLAVAMIVRVLV